MLPKSLENLIASFRMLPGVGEKTAERYALLITETPIAEVEQFAKSLMEVKENLHECSVCGNLCESDVCEICSDQSRDHSTIFVVESLKDVLAMEKMGEYQGVYHVLNGLISTRKGVLPEDLNLKTLYERANSAKEIILGVSATMDGETTAMYLARVLKQKAPNVEVSRIAHGLPSGGMLDYADEITLTHALSDRKKI